MPDVYQERPLSTDGVVGLTWHRETDTPGVTRVVPDAGVDVIWDGRSLLVAGPDTRPHPTPNLPGTLIGARFVPGTSGVALGVAPHSLADLRVPLDDLWPPARVRELADRLADTADPVQAQDVLADAVVAQVGDPPDEIAAPLRHLARRTGRVRDLAETIGLSERQLHRRCVAAFGYGPKTLHRIVRFDRALRAARAGEPFADVAYRAGYADQAHLSREVRALAGVPLGALVQEPVRPPPWPYPAGDYRAEDQEVESNSHYGLARQSV
ncbi:AraC-like DNA-binding protein [Herbihabitans rhizosphaerae]|uniref:AraC-like DNA-binding protein n=1 Tax=Herbihabitans rhizosphaerae TaxID=1872711 RepID=A0A4Q7KHF5_9PSEU|nr:helix-turn-helix domain-containing protein [Herbihabitans rhizosphaerae]RZS34340.1 AraC-like DNA-binding protein [Herbihabitans rhizosphaerae]